MTAQRSPSWPPPSACLGPATSGRTLEAPARRAAASTTPAGASSSDLHASGRFADEFATAFANGRAFLEADDALRRTAPPADRVDRGAAAARVTRWPPSTCGSTTSTWSAASTCRGTSPTRPRPGCSRGCSPPAGDWEQTDWYEAVGPRRVQALYDACRAATGLVDLPDDPAALSTEDSQRLRRALPGRSYPAEAQRPVPARCARRVSEVVGRISGATTSCASARQERRLWRLLRIGNAAYFLLGADAKRSLRLRVASPWDWRQAFSLRRTSTSGPRRRASPRWTGRRPTVERAVGAGPGGAGTCRGALEPRPLRPTPRGEDLPRHRRPTSYPGTSPSTPHRTSRELWDPDPERMGSGVDLAAGPRGRGPG